MSKFPVGLLLIGSLALAGCNGVVQRAADNTSVNVIPLATQKLTGTMSDSAIAPLSLRAQRTFTLSMASEPISFGDVDLASLPAAPQPPSALDVHVSFSNISLSCTPTASPLTLTISNVTLKVSDATHSSQSVTVNPDEVLALTKNGRGYTLSSNDIVLRADWNTFKSILEKSGTEIPNTAFLVATVSLNDGATGCVVTMDLASTLKQNIRF